MSEMSLIENINHKGQWHIEVNQMDKGSTTNLPWLRITLLLQTLFLVGIYYLPLPWNKNLLFLYSLPASWVLALGLNQIGFFKKLASTKNEKRSSMLLHSQGYLKELYHRDLPAIMIVQNQATHRYMAFANRSAEADERTDHFMRTLHKSGLVKALDELNDSIKIPDTSEESSQIEAVETDIQKSDESEETPSHQSEEKSSEE